MQVFGHRGAMHEAPDSTLAGFRHARAIGLDAVEFDVQFSADGHLVVIHDATVDRTTNGQGRVADFTLADLQALDARAQFAGWPGPCGVPTLDEVLTEVHDFASLLIEIKRGDPNQLDRIVPAVIAEIHAHGLGTKAMVSSFDPYALEVAARTNASLRRVINGAWRDSSTPERAIAAGVWGTDFDTRQVGQQHISWARQHGLWIIGWPCNSADDLRVLQGYGVDAVGSDCPSLILPLLEIGPALRP